ncbi:MAG: choline dehydrogenase [Candidatus Thioglobus sp.]|nr:choline dehydrogenase [Candidatus Thioglobus sp.]
MSDYDYIIVGAGSAGCVLANRLSKNPLNRVLLLEAGGSDRRFYIQMPIGYGKTYHQKAVNWMYMTEPSPDAGNRPSYWPRGKVLGGSSSINAMVYVRGNPKDFDDWHEAGNPGWSFDELLPYFKRMETWQHGGDDYRGGDGPLKVSDVSSQLHPLCKNFISAAKEIGFSFNKDMNGASQEGVGNYQITTHNGQRVSTSRAYLRPVMSRKNLTVIMNAHVTRILFEGKRASGVEYKKSGNLNQVNAKREVVLSSGAVNSPQLLQLSGVGPESVLKEANVSVIHHSPAVGKNLQDHLGVSYFYKSKVRTLNDQLRPWWGKLLQGMRYILTRTGPLSLSINQSGGFVRTRDGLKAPNIQLYFSPVSYSLELPGKRAMLSPDPFPAMLLGVSNCKSNSRGQIRIKSSDPGIAPIIEPNYLSHKDDVQDLLEGVKLLRKLAKTESFSKVILDEFRPGPECKSDAQLVEDIKDNSWTVFHPSSTCRMGPDPEKDVVDSNLKVYGIEGLRVADASIFPQLICGNINAATIMVGEKASDLILKDIEKH